MQNLSRYLHRSPRYVLRPLDNNIIRFVGPDQTPWEEATEVRDISVTGLAFTIPKGLEPKANESMAIEFEVPGKNDTMACFGLVKRIAEFNEKRVLVSVEFQKLSSSQRFYLLSGLLMKLEQDQRKFQKKHRFAIILKFIWGLIAVIFIFAAIAIWNFDF